MSSAAVIAKGGAVTSYYQDKINGLKLVLHDRIENLRRLEAQRNDLNAKGILSSQIAHEVNLLYA
jgi:26S proteasome regulatory subunit T6